jgi:acetylornithine deacetylase/succinyl-diaminopimelate desuccinylase-like protein
LAATTESLAIYERPAELLQQLIRFDTTNPPGNEADCITFIKELLAAAGIDSTILARTPERPNLVARLPGEGKAAPLLLHGHVDVVTTENQEWQQPPFDGVVDGGFIWGRGALDMKGGVAMMLSAVLRAKAEGAATPGDVVLAIISDEEAGGDYGAKFLVSQHGEHFAGIRYAIGEVGGFTFHLGGQRFYPIGVAEKGVCWMRATLRGPGGHGSLPVRGGAMAKLARLLRGLDERRLPVHVTPPARLMIEGMASQIGGLNGLLLGQLTNPFLTDWVLDRLGERGRAFDALLHNTVSVTGLHGSEQVNVIPSEVTAELDGRLLPGFGPADLIVELHQLVGQEVAFEVTRHEPGPGETDMGLFDTLAGILKEMDPGGAPIPLLLSGYTDARVFAGLGIQTYGFNPMQLPEEFEFSKLLHAADERIPVEAVAFGANAVYQALQRYG